MAWHICAVYFNFYLPEIITSLLFLVVKFGHCKLIFIYLSVNGINFTHKMLTCFDQKLSEDAAISATGKHITVPFIENISS